MVPSPSSRRIKAAGSHIARSHWVVEIQGGVISRQYPHLGVNTMKNSKSSAAAAPRPACVTPICVACKLVLVLGCNGAFRNVT